MISISTAKLLLFIALLVGPKGGDAIEIINNNSYCVWSHESTDWTLAELGQTSNHWPANGTNVSQAELNHANNADFQVAREITAHDWSQSPILNLPNGDVVEKQGNKIFYTTNAGGANQQIYTILTIANGKTL